MIQKISESEIKGSLFFTYLASYFPNLYFLNKICYI